MTLLCMGLFFKKFFMRHISILRGHERECVALTSESIDEDSCNNFRLVPWWPDVLQPRRIGEALGVSNFEIGSNRFIL